MSTQTSPVAVKPVAPAHEPIVYLNGEYVGRVFELEAGWYVHLQKPEDLLKPGCVQAVLAARERLLHYVNRKGGEFPEGTSRAAASLWLMQRDDGKGFTLPAAE